MSELGTVFNRGFWEGGYYLGKTLGEWTASSRPGTTERKVFVGKIVRYYARIGVAEVQIQAAPLAVGDEAWILGETSGALRVRIAELRLGEVGAPALEAGKGEIAAFPVP